MARAGTSGQCRVLLKVQPVATTMGSGNHRAPDGNNTFTAINRVTGKIITKHFGNNNATNHALELQDKASLLSIKKFGKILWAWEFRIGAILALPPPLQTCVRGTKISAKAQLRKLDQSNHNRLSQKPNKDATRDIVIYD